MLRILNKNDLAVCREKKERSKIWKFSYMKKTRSFLGKRATDKDMCILVGNSLPDWLPSAGVQERLTQIRGTPPPAQKSPANDYEEYVKFGEVKNKETAIFLCPRFLFDSFWRWMVMTACVRSSFLLYKESKAVWNKLISTFARDMRAKNIQPPNQGLNNEQTRSLMANHHSSVRYTM